MSKGTDMQDALIALGANLHNGETPPHETLQKAIQDIENEQFSIIKRSRFFTTPAFPAGCGPDYVNAALHVQVAAGLRPNQIFSPLTLIEAAHGRTRPHRWAGRSLDIDLLALGSRVYPDRDVFSRWANLSPQDQLRLTPNEMIVPHPRLHQRAFVLVPLMDIAPDWMHPVFGQTVRQMHAALSQSDRAGVVAIA